MDEAALLGGPPSIRASVPPWPQFGELELRLLQQTLESRAWWRMAGTQVKDFEAAFAAYHGARFGLAVTNGTHALELALRTLDVGPGDEVVIPSLTFVATSMAVLSVGARPIPVDVDAATWCVRPEAVRDAFTDRTRAVIPVHFAGHLADMEALSMACGERGIPIVEDAAHAHGARGWGRAAGSFGVMAAFSFQNFKLLTAGEGGMLLCADEETYRRAILLSNCGRPPGDTRYDHLLPGSNYRMSEFQGCVLNAQLTRLDEQARRREHNARLLGTYLEQVGGVQPQARDARMEQHAHYMYVFTYDPAAFAGLDRATFVAALAAEGVPAFRMYPCVQDTEHFAPAFIRAGGDIANLPESPVSRRIAVTGAWIHHRALLGEEALVEQIAEALSKIRSRAERIVASAQHGAVIPATARSDDSRRGL